MLKKILFVITAAVCITSGITEAVKAANIEVVASGLDNPRGLTFGPDGDLYVAEAGTGGLSRRCVPSPSQIGATLCYGLTGAVTRIHNGISKRVVTGLPSIGLSNGNGSYGPHAIKFDPATGKAYVLVGFASDARNRDNIIGNKNIGSLLAINSFDGSSSFTKIADLLRFEITNDPDRHGLISNPYSFVIKNNTAYVVDSGANDFSNVALNGSGVTLQTVFPIRTVTNPSNGQNSSIQSVPIAVAVGPDGALYVAEFTGYPYPNNASRIYRIVPGQQPVVYATGFTQIIDIAFDAAGNLNVLQYGDETLPSNANTVLQSSGVLIRVAPNGTRKDIVRGGGALVSPNSLAIGPDNAIYVTNYGTSAGKGQVIRITDNVVAR
jgi:hypothetical protein